MRLLAAALAVLASVPALAQTQYADSSGGFASLNEITLSGDGLQGLDGTVGYRFSNGTDLGLRIGYASGFNYDGTRLGVITGVTRSVGAGFTGRLEGTVEYLTTGGVRSTFSDAGVFQNAFDYRFRSVREDVSATVGRRVPLLRSLALMPSVGGYAVARQLVSAEYPAGTFQVDGSTIAAGVQGELPLTFRLFGKDAAIAVFNRFGLTGARTLGTDIPSGGRLRVNF